MSQSDGYQYQSYSNPASSLKSGPPPPPPPPMVNGQPSAMPHVQNGVQPPHFNPLGTSSSQSSRDPSREASRDPSPTQYLNNQYRPQLPRPPMPPIGGQQISNKNPATLPPRLALTQQDSPTVTPPPNFSSQPNAGAPVSTFSSFSNASGTTTITAYSSVPPSSKSFSSQPPISLSQTGSGNIAADTDCYSSSSIAALKSDLSISSLSSALPLARPQPPGSETDSNNLPPTLNQVKYTTGVVMPPTQVTSVDQSIRHVQSNPTLMSQGTQNLPPTSQIRSQQMLDQKSSVSTTLTARNQFQSNFDQPQGSNQLLSNSQSFPNIFPPTSEPPRSQSQSLFGLIPPNPPVNHNTITYPPRPNDMQGQSQNSNSNAQTLYGDTQSTQYAVQSQALSGPLSLPGSQSQYPPQPKLPGQYPTQPNLLSSQTDLSGPGPIHQQGQNVYSSHLSLASLKKYPQTSYSGQPPLPSTASMSAPNIGPGKPGAALIEPGQFPGKTFIPGMPPQPSQQILSPHDGRQQYPGEMSNVPLDNMSRRYPGGYPDRMNQLNSEMSGMTVTQSGFNKLWGMESVDLLHCRNILPPEKVEPPKVRLHQEFFDSINCSPDIFRCTVTKIPETNALLQRARLPLGILIHPFKDLNVSRTLRLTLASKDLNHLPVIQCSTIVRCRVCRTYINPFVFFVDSKRWKCNLCYRVNELPDEFQFDPVTRSYGDPSRRPEVKTSTIEFIAPSEYMLRPPQPAVYLFVLDVSRLAVESGYLNVVCNTIAEELARLPGDGRTQVGFLAVDSTIHFYSMPDNVSQPHEMIMLDIDDIFLPCPDNLIVNLKEREELIRDLLAQLPTKFQGTHDTSNALGAGLQAAFKLMSPTGGRVTVFQTCLPNLGPGALQAREDPNNRAGKDVPHLNPATDFYKRMALDCSGQQIAVDLFLLNSQYSDMATLAGICKFSGGCIYHLPLFRINKPQHAEILERMLRRHLTRKIGFEAVMRIRCTRGLSIHTFHGNFFVRSTDLLSLPNVNPDAGFGMQVSIEENLSDVQNVCFQAALLYTSSKGERRIRVHTLCLPVSASLADILYSADQQCIVGLLSKMAVDRSQQSSLSDARDALINVGIDVLSAYKLLQSSASGGLLAPVNLKLLPLYIVALLKCTAFRSGTSTRLDDRVFAMCQLKVLPLSQLMQVVYPDLYPVHALDDRNAKDIDGKICPQPPRLHLSAEKLDSRGAFLMDAGDRIYIYVGKNIHPTFCSNVLGVSAFASIPEEMYELPEMDTTESEMIRNFVFSLQEEKPYYASLQIIRDDSHFRALFTERLIEDRIESALSYYEFLQHLKTQVK